MIELALGEAFVALDAPPLAQDLAGIDWDSATFEFLPSLSFHRLASNAPAIWSAINSGGVPPPATPLSHGEALIVWRSDEVCRFRSLDHEERDALL